MAVWEYRPTYDIVLVQPNPRHGAGGQPDTLVWQLRTLAEFQGVLVTANGVNHATLSLHDPDGFLADTVAPQAMNTVRVRLRNRRGVWGTAWTGFVDEAHEIQDAGQARKAVELECGGPYKKWEVTRQSAGDVIALAVGAMQNMAGSEVVRYSARAVGYNPANIAFDPIVDSGTGLFASVPASVYSNPDQQTWSAPVQQILAHTGLEFFFDEDGYGHYRRVGFLGTGQRAIPRIEREDMLAADLARGDRGLVTSVEVRYGPFPAQQTAVRSERNTSSMVAQIGTRALIIPAPWLLSPAAAQYLANTLLDQYAAGAATGSLTIVADPTIRVGTIVEVAGPRPGQGAAWYYVSSVTYQCAWGSTWTMTLGLSYGRARGNTFPYVGGVAYPSLRETDVTRLPNAAVPLLAFDPLNSSKVVSPLTVQAQAGLLPMQLSSTALPVGSVVELRATSTGGGAWVGPAHQYTVVAGPSGQDPGIVGLATGTPAGTAYATIITYGAGDAGASPAGTGTGSGGASTGAGTTPVTSPATRPQGTASNGVLSSDATPGYTGTPTTYAQKALAAALTLNKQPYRIFHAGPLHWDCSGLIAWAFTQVGFPLVTPTNWSNDGENGDMGPNGGPDGEFHYFIGKGAREIPLSQAQPGDLIFCYSPSYSFQHGFSHIAFLLRPGMSFGGNSPTLGVGPIAVAGFTSDGGAPFNKALDMSSIQP